MTLFAKRILGAVRTIPRGETRTYKQIAAAVGNPRAYRAVGNVLNRYDARKFKVPCHRVIRSDGKIGGYRWGSKMKAALLKAESK